MPILRDDTSLIHLPLAVAKSNISNRSIGNQRSEFLSGRSIYSPAAADQSAEQDVPAIKHQGG